MKGGRPVIEIRESYGNSEGIVLCQDCEQTRDACGTKKTTYKTQKKDCYVTTGGCAKKKKRPKEPKCRFPIKRPLPACPDDNCTAVDESFSDMMLRSYQKMCAISDKSKKHNVEPQKAFKVTFKGNDDSLNVQKYVSETRQIPEVRSERCKEKITIDNAAQIMNAAIPREGYDEGIPMKLKPQFWSKFTKTTTLPVKIDASEV